MNVMGSSDHLPTVDLEPPLTAHAPSALARKSLCSQKEDSSIRQGLEAREAGWGGDRESQVPTPIPGLPLPALLQLLPTHRAPRTAPTTR